MTISNFHNLEKHLRKPGAIVLLMSLCFVLWCIVRISCMYQYQTPPNQTIHPNYFTFHEMSQSWDQGRKLGMINLNRMLLNMKRSSLDDYVNYEGEKDSFCTYLSLDPGYAIMLSLSRKVITSLPDTYLRAAVLQMICDGLMLFAIFFTLLRWGPLQAAMAGVLYAIHPAMSFQAIFPFQYFWEAWFFSTSIIALIWARRCAIENRKWFALFLILLVACIGGFSLWMRSSALIYVVAILLAVVFTPSLRRYAGIFILALTLTALPQIVRASSVQGHFALSTRMSWHTAMHALGRYPNALGIEDDDLYSFYLSNNEYGIAYNYCDYGKHDRAMEKAYAKLWQEHPDIITRAIAARITGNILYNSDVENKTLLNPLALIGACIVLLWAFLRRGEYLFVSLLAGIVYLAYNTAVGFFYYIAMPYSAVTQLCLIFVLPALLTLTREVAGIVWSRREYRMNWWPPYAPLAKTGFVVTGLGILLISGALLMPPVKAYLFPPEPSHYPWSAFMQPNREDNEKLVSQWENLPEKEKGEFLKLVHKNVKPTDDPRHDVGVYITQNFITSVYPDKGSGKEKTYKSVFSFGPLQADLIAAMKAVSGAIPGWNMESISMINIKDPESWDSRKLHIQLRPNPHLTDADYQKMATEKLARYNFMAEWKGPYELVARHNGYGCDALRAVLGIYYGSPCPYDPRTGGSPLTPEMDPTGAVKSLTSGAKKAS